MASRRTAEIVKWLSSYMSCLPGIDGAKVTMYVTLAPIAVGQKWHYMSCLPWYLWGKSDRVCHACPDSDGAKVAIYVMLAPALTGQKWHQWGNYDMRHFCPELIMSLLPRTREHTFNNVLTFCYCLPVKILRQIKCQRHVRIRSC